MRRKSHINIIRKQAGRKLLHEDVWRVINIDNISKIYYRVVDEDIIKQMPLETETFIERNALQSFVKRMKKLVRVGI